MQRSTAHAQWVVEVLVWASAETIQGNGETFYAKLGHDASLICEYYEIRIVTPTFDMWDVQQRRLLDVRLDERLAVTVRLP